MANTFKNHFLRIIFAWSVLYLYTKYTYKQQTLTALCSVRVMNPLRHWYVLICAFTSLNTQRSSWDFY